MINKDENLRARTKIIPLCLRFHSQNHSCNYQVVQWIFLHKRCKIWHLDQGYQHIHFHTFCSSSLFDRTDSKSWARLHVNSKNNDCTTNHCNECALLLHVDKSTTPSIRPGPIRPKRANLLDKYSTDLLKGFMKPNLEFICIYSNLKHNYTK